MKLSDEGVVLVQAWHLACALKPPCDAPTKFPIALGGIGHP